MKFSGLLLSLPARLGMMLLLCAVLALALFWGMQP